MKILNLYDGIGGNRKLWGDEHEITAVEINPEIAEIYMDNFPGDEMIITDAHEYLLNNFKEFGFIWSSTPCPSHTRLNTASFPSGSKEYIYPEMELYQQIIFLTHWFHGKFVIENVIPYYKPLIEAQEIGRHLFWANFRLDKFTMESVKLPHEKAQSEYLQQFLGYDLSKYNIKDKRQILRNCVIPEMGLKILNRAMDIQTEENAPQQKLF